MRFFYDPLGILCKIVGVIIIADVLSLTLWQGILLFIGMGLFAFEFKYKER